MNSEKRNGALSRILIYDNVSTGHNPLWLACAAEAAMGPGIQVVVAAPRGAESVEDSLSLLAPDSFERVDTGEVDSIPLRDAFALAEKRRCDRVFFPFFDDILTRTREKKDTVAASVRAMYGFLFRPNLVTEVEIPSAGGLGERLLYLYFKLKRTKQGKVQRRRLRARMRMEGNVVWWRRYLGQGGKLRVGVIGVEEGTKIVSRILPGSESSIISLDPWLSRSDASKSAARKELGLPEDRFLFLHCGTSYPVKGLGDACRAILEGHPDLKEKALLVRAGRVIDPEERDLAERAGIVVDRFIPQRELDLHYAACDAVLMPYRNHQGSSGVLVHAAANDRPVVAPDYSMIGEIVRRHDLGFLFEHLSVESLSAVMHQAMMAGYEQTDRSREYVAANSRERFVEEIRSFLSR